MARLAALRERIAQLKPSAAAAVQTALAAFDARAAALQGAAGGAGDPGGGRGAGAPATGAAAVVSSLADVVTTFSGLMNSLQSADVQPTANQRAAIARARAAAAPVIARWTALRTTELSALNVKLKAAGLPALTSTPDSRTRECARAQESADARMTCNDRPVQAHAYRQMLYRDFVDGVGSQLPQKVRGGQPEDDDEKPCKGRSGHG